MRPMLRRLHRWIGLALALPLIVQALTGLILAGEPIVAAFAGVAPANGLLTKPDDLRTVDVGGVLTTASAAVPADLVPVRWRVQPSAIVAVDFAAPEHPQTVVQVVVDTVLMKAILVRREPDGFYHWVHSVHETLLLGPVGRTVIGWIGVALLLMTLTGIPVWWPPRLRWRSGFSVSRRARGWRLHRELHGAAGIWMLALLVLQSVSGIALAFPQTARSVAGLPAVGPPGGRQAANAAVDLKHLMVAGVAAAQGAVPDGLLQDLRQSPTAGRPMIAVLLPPGYWEGSPEAVVSMDAATARVLSVQDPRTASVGGAVLGWLRAWHGSGAAGPAGRLLMCLLALLLPLFPVTGLAMWLLRRRVRRRGAAMTHTETVRQ